MAITDEEIKELELAENELADMMQEIQEKQKELNALNGKFEGVQKKLRDKFGIAPYDAAKLSSQFRLIKKVVEDSKK